MKREHQAGVAKAQRRSSARPAGKPGIIHPADKEVSFPLVASGLAPDDKGIDFVFGCLIDTQDMKFYPGITLPFPAPYRWLIPGPFRWAIYFSNDPGQPPDRTHPFTLQVFGIAHDTMGGATVRWRDKVAVKFMQGQELLPFGPPVIAWPQSGDSHLCPSNFCPYGSYDTAGTIAVTLRCGGGVVASASSIYYDPTGGTWAAQFDPFPQPSGACELDVTETTATGTSSAGPATGLTFDNC